MRVTLKQILVSSMFVVLPLVATGCGKDNPVAPKVEQKQYEDVTVTLVSLYAVADGDGIEGAGDFKYEAEVYDGTSLKVSGSPQIDTGNSHTINRQRVIRIEKGQAYNIQVKFRASEMDQNILGTVYADSRMDNLTGSRVHTNGSASAGFNDGERWITLGSGDLQLRLVYTITSKPVA